MKHLPPRQSGASLIEVLVAVLVLSFGMLALGGMLAYAVQLPKLSGYRSTAVTLAAGHIERMRANTSGFVGETYKETMTYNTTLPTVTPCTYPSCTATEIATLDKDEVNRALRRELPLGGMRMVCNGACTAMEGDLWVLWQEPTTFAALSAATSDECPVSSVDAPFTISGTQPRCLHIRFKL